MRPARDAAGLLAGGGFRCLMESMRPARDAAGLLSSGGFRCLMESMRPARDATGLLSEGGLRCLIASKSPALDGGPLLSEGDWRSLIELRRPALDDWTSFLGSCLAELLVGWRCWMSLKSFPMFGWWLDALIIALRGERSSVFGLLGVFWRAFFRSSRSLLWAFENTCSLAFWKSLVKQTNTLNISWGSVVLVVTPKYCFNRMHFALVPSIFSRKAETCLMAPSVKSPVWVALKATTSSSSVSSMSPRLSSSLIPVTADWLFALASWREIRRTFSSWFSTSSKSCWHWSQKTFSASKTAGMSS